MSCLPKAGDTVGTRHVICVKDADCIIFGERVGDLPNCGAYVTDLREWLDYERGNAAMLLRTTPTHESEDGFSTYYQADSLKERLEKSLKFARKEAANKNVMHVTQQALRDALAAYDLALARIEALETQLARTEKALDIEFTNAVQNNFKVTVLQEKLDRTVEVCAQIVEQLPEPEGRGHNCTATMRRAAAAIRGKDQDGFSTYYPADSLKERLGGPHEWGYRDVTDGAFIKDDAPHEALARIEALEKDFNWAIEGNHKACLRAELAEKLAVNGADQLAAFNRAELTHLEHVATLEAERDQARQARDINKHFLTKAEAENKRLRGVNDVMSREIDTVDATIEAENKRLVEMVDPYQLKCHQMATELAALQEKLDRAVLALEDIAHTTVHIQARNSAAAALSNIKVKG